MKWSVIVLIVLGLLAAIATSILVATFRAAPSGSSAKGSSSNVEVILANTSLPAMTVITSKHIAVNTVSEEALPDGYFSNPVQVIGRVLATSVVEGQVFTKSCLVTDGSAAQLAAAIPHGMRAVSVMLSNQAITGGMLYPGSVVDILASFRLPSRDRSKGQAISTTLLQGIQVIVVDDISIVSRQDDKKSHENTRKYNNGNQKLMVTLMVNPRQAEALQLAREYGSVSVTMRNPLDRYPVDSDTTVLSEGQLAKFGSVMTPAVLTAQQRMDFLEEVRDSAEEIEGDGKEEARHPIRERRAKSSQQWGVTVIRGRDVQMQQLDTPKQSVTSWAEVRR